MNVYIIHVQTKQNRTFVPIQQSLLPNIAAMNKLQRFFLRDNLVGFSYFTFSFIFQFHITKVYMSVHLSDLTKLKIVFVHGKITKVKNKSNR